MAKARKRSHKPRQRAKPRSPLDRIPNEASVIATDTLTMPDGRQYTILKTTQTDPYDPPPGRATRRRR